jgi:sulfite reductase alpha subunit
LKAIGKDVDVRIVKAPRNNPFMFFKKEELRPSPFIEELKKRGMF